MTLEQLAERMHMHKGHLSKIERGLQGYTQDFLEAAAEHLNCDPADILIRDPSDPDGIWSIWDNVEPVDRDTARRILAQLDKRNKKPMTGN